MMYVLIVLALLSVLMGVVGAIIPGIAGPPFSYAGLLLVSSFITLGKNKANIAPTKTSTAMYSDM